MGWSDWSGPSITVYLNVDEPKCSSPQLLRSLATHLTTLCEHLFFSSKPPRPTQSRWTGVPSVSRWCLALSLFHQMLGPLLSSLATSGGKDPGPGFGASEGAVLDNDAGNSRTTILCLSLSHLWESVFVCLLTLLW